MMEMREDVLTAEKRRHTLLEFAIGRGRGKLLQVYPSRFFFDERKLEVTEVELEFRAKNYHDIRAQRQRELSCASCGNVLSHKAQEIFSHPIFDILQCRKCNERARNSLKLEDSSVCQLCTAVSKSSYKCDRKNCHYKFCQACIRRNAPKALAGAGSKKWICFACNSEPLWKLRGVCAAVMSLNSTMTKKRKVSRNRSSDTEDEKINFKNISYVRSRRLNKCKQLMKHLKTICDEESSPGISEPLRPLFGSHAKATKQQKIDTNKKLEENYGCGNISRANESSDDSDVQEIKSIRHKKGEKFEKLRESPGSRRKNRITDKNSHTRRKELRRSISMSPRKFAISISNTSSDDSELDAVKRRIMTLTNRKFKDKNKSSKRLRKVSSDENSNSEGESGGNRKFGKSKEEIKQKGISIDSSEENEDVEEEEDESSRQRRKPAKNIKRISKENGKGKTARDDNKSKKLSKDDDRSKKTTKEENKSKKSRRDESPDDEDSEDDASNRGRISRRNEKERLDEKSKKPQSHRRLMKTDSIPSDSSSGKEFCKAKLFPNSFVVLKRIEEMNQHCTKTPELRPETPKDILSKDQTFAMKNSVSNFLADLKKAATKLVDDIEVVRTKYCMKTSMRPTDVDSLILETKNVVANLKKCVDNRENKMDDYYDNWCKKAKLKNVLKEKKTSIESATLSSSREGTKKSSLKKRDSSNESNRSPSREKSRSPSSVAPDEDDECPNVTVISDCNSEEIFSGDDIRNTTKKPHSPSSSRENDRVLSREPSAEKASKNSDVSSDEVFELGTTKKLGQKSLNHSSSTELSDDSINKNEKKQEDIRKLQKKSTISKTSRVSSESIDLSDVDIFETTKDSADEGKIDKKKSDKTDTESSDTEEKSAQLKPSDSTKSRAKTKGKVSRSSTDSQSAQKRRNASESPKIQEDSIVESSDNEDGKKSSLVKRSDKEGEISSKKSDIELNDNDNIPQDVVNEKIATSLQSDDEASKTCEPESPKRITPSRSPENDENEDNSEKPCIMKSSLHLDESLNVTEQAQKILSKDYDDSAKNDNNDDHLNYDSNCSLETLVLDVNDQLDISTTRNSRDDEKILEKADSFSPDENNDETFEKTESKSPSENTTHEKSRKTVSEKRKSRSNSPIVKASKKQLSDEKMNEKSCDVSHHEGKSRSNSPEVTNSKRRSSDDTDENDETPVDKPLKSRSNISRLSTSSTPSEADDLEARKKLLLSSNSEESSGAEDSLVLRSPRNLENDDTPPTPPECDSNNLKDAEKDKTISKSENTEQQTLRLRRNKFRIENHPHFMTDERLRRRCVVSLNRLNQKVLDRYSKALEKSRDYVDSKELKRLVALDKLDKKKTASKSSDSGDDKTSHKDLKKKKKSKTAKEREETLLDHLEKVKNGENIELNNDSEDAASDNEEINKNKPGNLSEDRLFAEAEKMAKKRLLESSDSEKEEEPSVPESSDKKDEKEEKTTKKKAEGAGKKEKSDGPSNHNEKGEDKADKSRWRKNKLLTLRISDSDSEDEKKKFELSQEKSSEKRKKAGSDSDDSEEKTSVKKKRIRRRVLHSDSDGEVSPPSELESSDESDEDPKKKNKDSSEDETKKKRKRKKRGDPASSSSDSLEEKRPKNRRKRIRTAASDSDSDLENSQGSPNKSGRKNIRKVIRDKQVADVTKQAAKDEEERLQRIAERQKLYNQMYENRLAGETKVDKLVLDFDEETKEPLISVDEGLVKKLKPHQAQGIKFMWDACFESLERTKTTQGSGCILAHCMGLGKSFQVVALSHTLLQHEETGIKTIMVVCPLSTVLNWANEFKIWLENLPDGDDIEIYELTKMKQNCERKYQLQSWRRTGGVMIIGYEMFRNLSNPGKKVRKNIQDVFTQCLVDPGPDLIVCDEGHLLKNEDTALSKAMRKVRTLRRIVLTGTPLQNNLIEYHCMVQFVKPNLLGTKKEFTNRFENPITNGQFDDSTEYDVRLMKKRAHVLHKMLEGSVQRLDYSVLTPFLPPKQEYVIFVKLTEVQVQMYRHYLDNYARRAGGVGGSLFADFQALQRIWTHPMVMQMRQKQKELADEKKRVDDTDSEGSLRDFIDDDSDTPASSSDSDIQSVSNSDEDAGKKRKRSTRANPVKEEPEAPTLEKNEELLHDIWWPQFVKEEDYEDMRVSCKLLILFAILKQSHAIGDKVLVFSQSLFSLSLIEDFLRMINDATRRGLEESESLGKHSGTWNLGVDYFRLDGQTSADNRRRWCDIFNRPTNTRARLFLISTRAGGLGINLTAANRVIIFDASWNPSHDVQSIFRIYRFGQKKPCYVYRLLAAGTMEEKIYNRQVTKLSLSCRVVDEQQIERHYSNNALAELYELEVSEDEKTLNLPKDRLLADIFLQYKHCVFNYHEHDSLLENQAGEELDEEERQQAWLEYEEEKKGKRLLPPAPYINYQNELLMQQTNLILAQQSAALTNPAMMLDYENIRKMMSKDYPGVSEAQQRAMATRTVYEMYNYVERQAMANQLPRVNQVPLANQVSLANQVPLANQTPLAMINMGTGALLLDNRHVPQSAPVAAHPTPEMIRLYQQSLIQQNGQLNLPKNQNFIGGDSLALAQNSSMTQMPQIPSQSSTLPAVIDDDIIEIPASPEKILGTPPVPGGSRKSQEE